MSAPALVEVREKRTNRHALEWLLLIALAALFLQRGLVPGWRTLNTDFPNYYLVARLYRSGYRLDRIYEWEWLQRQKDRLELRQPLVGYAPHPPLCFTVVLPFAWLPALAAKRCWLLLNVVLLAAVIALLRKMTRLHWRRVAMLVLLAVVPLANNFLLGQVYVILLLLMTLALYAWVRQRDIACGLLLAVGAALKLYPAAFVLYFARKKQWKAAAAVLAGIAASVAAAVWLVGFEPVRVFGAEVLPRALRGDLLDPYDLRLNSIAVLLRHLLLREPELNPSPLAHLPHIYAVMQPLCLALLVAAVLMALGSSRRDAEREKVEWALFTGLLLALSPIPATYHNVLLITPAIVVIDHALQVHRRLGIALAGAYALVCLPIPQAVSARAWVNILNMPRLWGILAFIALVGVLLLFTSEERPAVLTRRNAGIFVALASVFAVPGIGVNWHNLSAQSAPGEAIPMRPAWMATDPAMAGDRILFTAMVPEGYVVASFRNGALTRLPLRADAFHPAVTAGSSDAWVELSGQTSRIARFDLTNGRLGNIEVMDGEQPVVSSGGRWLAFTRQTAGQSALWVRKVGGTANMAGSEERLTPASYDVQEAAFLPDATLVFSARGPEGPGLFRVLPAPSSDAPRIWISGPVRYPAVSPDGEWLAFSRREHGSWHLWTRNVASGEETRLTQGGCNSIKPAWSSDSKQLIYASDCGRGLDLTSLRKLTGDW